MATVVNKKARMDMVGKTSKKWVKKANQYCITTWENGIQKQTWQ